MASGDYSKTQYNNGAPPAINATNLNNNENKTKELDTDVAALKSGTMTVAGVKTFSSSPLIPSLAQTDSSTKAAPSAFVHTADTPVSDISRILDVTGDGVPEIPDDPAGVTYLQDAWATVDGWATFNATGTVSVASGMLKSIGNNSQAYNYVAKSLTGVDSKYVIVKVKTSIAATLRVSSYNGSAYITDVDIVAEANKMYFLLCILTTGITQIRIGTLNSGASTVEIDYIYIGTGAYLTKVADRSGNSLDLLNTAVTPVNTANGRGLQFNGAPSRLSSPLPFSLPDIFTVCCKAMSVNSTTVARSIFSTAMAGVLGWFEIDRNSSSGDLRVIGNNGSTSQTASFVGFFEDNVVASIGVSFNWTTKAVSVYKNGVLFGTGTLTGAIKPAPAILYLGERTGLGFPWLGTLSNIQLHSRALTEDEHYRYHIDPTSVDSSVRSVTPLADSQVVRDAVGNIQANGFKFPGTQVASTDPNTLDDYEEGTFTPVLQFGGASVGITYSIQVGRYTKIGNNVSVSMQITLTSKGTSTGAATISGLPFVSNSNVPSALSIRATAITFADFLTGFIAASSTVFTLNETTNAGASTTLADTDFANTSLIIVSAFYTV